MANPNIPAFAQDNAELAAIFGRLQNREEDTKFENWEKEKDFIVYGVRQFLALEPLLDHKELFDQDKGASLSLNDLEKIPGISQSPFFTHIKTQFNRKETLGEGKSEGDIHGGENINPFRVNKALVANMVIAKFLKDENWDYAESLMTTEEHTGYIDRSNGFRDVLAKYKTSKEPVPEEITRELFALVKEIHDKYLKDIVVDESKIK